MVTACRHQRQPIDEFRGFESLSSNYIYCPNQFFDVCIPNCSRGAVRLVGHVLFKTLGWLDKNGQPVQQNITVSYRDLITEAGISRGAIAKAIDEAIGGGFIICSSPGRPNRSRLATQSASYLLRWDTGHQYTANPQTFQGFYAGEGHRTPVPNAFFDRVLPPVDRRRRTAGDRVPNWNRHGLRLWKAKKLVHPTDACADVSRHQSSDFTVGFF